MTTVLIYCYILFLENTFQFLSVWGIIITHCRIGCHILYILCKIWDCNCFLNTKVSSKIKTVVVRVPFVLHMRAWAQILQVTIFVWGRPSLSSVHRTGSCWITVRTDNNRRKDGVKAGGLFLLSNVHMKATILVLYQRRQLNNSAACYKSEKSYRLLMEKCQFFFFFFWKLI